MPSYVDTLTEHRRLIILRSLSDPQIGPSCNDSILQSICNNEFGCRSSRDQIRSAAEWLREQGLITYKVQESGTYVLTVNGRGEEVAAGIVTVPGIKRPSAGA